MSRSPVEPDSLNNDEIWESFNCPSCGKPMRFEREFAEYQRNEADDSQYVRCRHCDAPAEMLVEDGELCIKPVEVREILSINIFTKLIAVICFAGAVAFGFVVFEPDVLWIGKIGAGMLSAIFILMAIGFLLAPTSAKSE